MEHWTAPKGDTVWRPGWMSNVALGAVVAAQKGADPGLAATISSGTPGEALKAAVAAPKAQVNSP